MAFGSEDTTLRSVKFSNSQWIYIYEGDKCVGYYDENGVYMPLREDKKEAEISVEAAQAILEEGSPVLSFIDSTELIMRTATGWYIRIACDRAGDGDGEAEMKFYISKSE